MCMLCFASHRMHACSQACFSFGFCRVYSLRVLAKGTCPSNFHILSFLSFFLSFLFVVPQLRFKRMGRKKRPFYRLVAIDSRRKREGLALEELGWYNPLTKETYINAESVQKWLSDGAEPSDTVASLLKKAMPTFEAK